MLYQRQVDDQGEQHAEHSGHGCVCGAFRVFPLVVTYG